jgi:hypothetical protein
MNEHTLLNSVMTSEAPPKRWTLRIFQHIMSMIEPLDENQRPSQLHGQGPQLMCVVTLSRTLVISTLRNRWVYNMTRVARVCPVMITTFVHYKLNKNNFRNILQYFTCVPRHVCLRPGRCLSTMTWPCPVCDVKNRTHLHVFCVPLTHALMPEWQFHMIYSTTWHTTLLNIWFGVGIKVGVPY